MSITEGAAELLAAWKIAAANHERHDTLRTMHAEQEAHDVLVDFVEAHGLNYSEYDPRGTEDEPDLARSLGVEDDE